MQSTFIPLGFVVNIVTSAQSNMTAPENSWHARSQAAVLFCIFLTIGIVPRFDIALVILLGILSLWFVGQNSKARRSLTGFDHTFWWTYGTAILFCLYLAANSLWSQDVAVAMGKTALFAVLVAIVFVSTRSLQFQPAGSLTQGARASIWGSAIGFAVTCVEFVLNHPLRWSVFKAFPAIRSEGNSIQVLVKKGNDVLVVPPGLYRTALPDEILIIQTDGLNRALVALLLISWPLLAIAYRTLPERYRLPVTGAIAALVVIAIVAGSSATAKAALLMGAAVFLLSRLWMRFSITAIAAAWFLSVVLVVPLGYFAFKGGLNETRWIFESARDRIAIWGVTAEKTMENPLLGVGIRSTRVLNRQGRETSEKTLEPYPYVEPEHAPGELIAPPRLGLHSHNQYLQVWFELGAVGATLLLLMGLSLLRTIRNSAAWIQPYQLAAFSSASVVAAFGFGLWQTWLLAAYALAIILLAYANALTLANPAGNKS